MKSIEVTIGPQGETKIETRGFAGSSCREASQFLQRALGQSMAENLTGEFSASSNVHESNSQRN